MKRFVCFLLTLVMIVSLVPATVLTASAASSLNTSDQAIEILKQFEGFSATAYMDGGKYYIGYGTYIDDPSVYPQGITKSKATELLKEHIVEVVDKEINNFAKKWNLAFTQNQHDALALFSYNCGTAWMSSNGAFRNAVVNGKKGNDFLNAICLYVGSNTEYFAGLMNRRLAEANMYLNNSYSAYKPSNYTYVVLDSNGGTMQDSFGNNLKAFAFDSSTAPALNLMPTKSGDSFVGWYLEGNPVTTLDQTVATKTLVAKWATSGSDVTAKYDINSSEAASRKVYKDHSYSAEAKGELKANSKFSVTKEFIDSNNVKWVYGSGTGTNGKSLVGWVGLCDLDEKNTAETVLATGTIIADSLNVREASTSASDIIGQVKKNTVVKILAYKYEYTASGTVSWGKIMHNGNIGWINLAYVDLKQATAEDNTSVYGKTGTIVNAEEVNIRSAAGVGNALVTKLKKGTKVTVYETKQLGTGTNAATWGRIKWDGVKEGWVYMFYVQLDGTNTGATTGGANSNVALYTGVVTSFSNLNVRTGPAVTNAQVGSLPTGTKINIYETTSTNGVQWGRTDNGWVCMLYVNATATGATNNNGANHVLVKNVGTITAATLSLRKAATNNSEQLALLNQGDTVTIVEQVTENTTTGSKLWGKVTVNGVTGYVNLAYVSIKETTEIIPDVDANPGTSNGEAVVGVVANCVSVNIRSAAGVRNTLVTTLPNGTQVKVYEQVTVDNAPWGRIDQGWVCMNYITLGGTATGGNTGSTGTTTVPGATTPGVISATGIVNSNTDLNVRAGAGLAFAKVDALKKGTRVTIYEQTIADGMVWGKINSGWICMSYITVDSSSNSGTGVMGTVARCFSHVNVRSAPGTGNALVGTIQVGARVEVFEQRLYSGQYWGRVAQGWVCMQYIILDGELPPTEDTPATTTPTEGDNSNTNTGAVNNNAAVSYSFAGTAKSNVDVRKDATDKADLAGTITAGTAINFTALKMNRTEDNLVEVWAKTNDYGTPGWINLAYVNYSIAGYVQVSNLTVYAAATTSSEGIGVLNLNQGVTIYDLALEGTAVWGKVDIDTVNGVVGWIQLSKVSYAPAAITSTDAGGVQATATSAIDAYTSWDGATVSHKLAAGATVYLKNFVADHGIVWGVVSINGETAYVNMSKLAYTFGATVKVELNARNVPASNADSVVKGVLPAGATVTVTSLMAASDGSIWGQIQTSDDLNGCWVDLQHLDY